MPVSPSIGAFKVVGNEYYANSPMTEERINGVLTGWSFNGDAAFGLGISVSGNWTGGSGGTILAAPGASLTLTVNTWDITNLIPADFRKKFTDAHDKACKQ